MTRATRAYPAISENVVDQLQKLGRDIAVARETAAYVNERHGGTHDGEPENCSGEWRRATPAVGNRNRSYGTLGCLAFTGASAIWWRLKATRVALQEDIKNLPARFSEVKEADGQFDF